MLIINRFSADNEQLISSYKSHPNIVKRQIRGKLKFYKNAQLFLKRQSKYLDVVLK